MKAIDVIVGVRGAERTFFRRWYFWATHARLALVIEKARLLEKHLGEGFTYV
jgi:hypothetical protein